jgi:pimeloyl-ACP methyl ester carboxylesterase
MAIQLNRFPDILSSPNQPYEVASMKHGAKISVGDYQLFFQSFGDGAPTVVFESGGECDCESLANLARQVKPFAHALVYDRAGLGRSDPAPRPRTIQDAVRDLHALLHTAQVPGPYLLVGHSFGGLIARLYAAQYRREVVGLVLLDVPHPEQPLRDLELLPARSSEEPAALTTCRDTLSAEWTDAYSNSEGFDRATSAAQVLGSGHLGDMPLVVVTAGIDEWEQGFPAEIACGLEQSWMRLQQELVALSTNSMHIIATESTHDIQECQPELVVDIIHKLVQDIRTGSTASQALSTGSGSQMEPISCLEEHQRCTD